MAGALALNTYKTYRVPVTTGITTAYTVPNGVSAIHLFSAVANTSAGVATVTVYHNRGDIYGSFELIKNAKIPTTDVLNPIGGSLVLEVGDKIEVQGSANSVMNFTISILESAK
jgi:hypothetical protein